MLQKKDLYYITALIFTVAFFGGLVIPPTFRLLVHYGVAMWLIIITVCILIPISAVILLWLIINEIQEHFKTEELSDAEVQKSQLVKKVFTEDDEKFIEAKMREQLDKFKFQDEDAYELYADLILTYTKNQIKITKTIPLIAISNMVEIPKDVVKDILLVLIADGLVDGIIKDDILECSE